MKTLEYDQVFKPLASGTILMKQQPKSTEQIYKGNAFNHSKYNSNKEKKANPHRKVGSKNHSAKNSTFDKNSIPNLHKHQGILDTDRNLKEQSRKSIHRISNRKSIEV